MSLRKLIVTGIVAITSVAVLVILVDNIERQEISNNKKPSDEGSQSTLTPFVDTTVTSISSPYVKEYSLPVGTWPNAILVDRSGIGWTAGSRSHTLISFDPKQGQIESSYPITEEKTFNDDVTKEISLMVWTMVEDNDGFIWFSQFGPNSLWRFDPHTGTFDIFDSVSNPPYQMKVDKETGDIWYTTLTRNTLGVIQKIENESNSTYKIAEFDVGVDSYPAGLFLEKGHVWISEIQNHKLIKFNVIRDNGGIVKDVVNALEIPSNDSEPIYLPTDLLISNSNSVWFTEHGTSTITNYQMNSSRLTRFPTSTNQYHTTTLPFWMKESTNGQGFWFNEHTGNRIGFFDTVTMVLTEYEIPTRPSDGYIVYPLGIAVDPADSKKLWFSEWNTDKIAVVDRSIPVPFNIHSDVTKVVLSNHNDTARIHINVTKNDSIVIPSYNKIVSLKVSSSMEPAAGLVNMTAILSTDTIDLAEITEEATLQLTLQNHYAPSGNYVLAISATDGSVTKSIFLDLVVE